MSDYSESKGKKSPYSKKFSSDDDVETNYAKMTKGGTQAPGLVRASMKAIKEKFRNVRDAISGVSQEEQWRREDEAASNDE
jgi:hypothetical protein